MGGLRSEEELLLTLDPDQHAVADLPFLPGRELFIGGGIGLNPGETVGLIRVGLSQSGSV